jgi:hypothetical protein
MSKMAIFFQETGEEGFIEYDKGETLEQLLERSPPEWRYRNTETPRRYQYDRDRDNYDLY